MAGKRQRDGCVAAFDGRIEVRQEGLTLGAEASNDQDPSTDQSIGT
jgi:hypothetical protein